MPHLRSSSSLDPHRRNKLLPLLCVAGALFLAACGSSSSPPAPAPSSWTIGPVVNGQNYSVGMPAAPTANPDGSWYFDFPIAPDRVDGVTRPVNEPTRTMVTAVFTVTVTAGAPQFVSVQDGAPGQVTITFQEAADNWSGQGAFASYRWYAPGHSITLAPGTYTVQIPFDPAQWTNVLGASGSSDPAGFAQAVANMANIGFGFGNPAAGATEHGVALPSGSARFTITGLVIQ